MSSSYSRGANYSVVRIRELGLLASVLLTLACSASGGVAASRSPAAHFPVQMPARPASSGNHPQRASRTEGKFRPDLVSAPTTHEVFVLRQGACRQTSCSDQLERSGDGGRSWRRLPKPPARLGNGTSATGTVGGLLFANADDGWLYGPALWATRDGGRHWQRITGIGQVEQMATGGGTVWVIVGNCRANHGCSSYHLLRSPIRASDFTVVGLPRALGHSGAPPALAADPATVAVLNTLRPSTANDSTIVEHSSADGASWTITTGPCFRDLGGRLSVGGSTIWSVCPTGSLAAIYRFTGTTFGVLHSRKWDLFNGTEVIAAGAAGAILTTIANHVYWTVDRGAHWHRSRLLPHSDSWLLTNATFPTARVGYAIDSGPTSARLVKSVNGGRSWHQVRS